MYYPMKAYHISNVWHFEASITSKSKLLYITSQTYDCLNKSTKDSLTIRCRKLEQSIWLPSFSICHPYFFLLNNNLPEFFWKKLRSFNTDFYSKTRLHNSMT